MPSPKTLIHPTFGSCERVPLVAIRWVNPLDAKAVDAVLSDYSLAPAAETPKMDKAPASAGRDPRANSVNQSDTLTWASSARLTDAVLSRLTGDSRVQWVAPVYRAVSADPGPQSYFAINPTVLFLTQDAAAAVGDLNSIDDAATIDRSRSQLLKGMVVVNLGKANAIDVAALVANAAKAKGVSTGVAFENIPYISPVSGCGCSGSSSAIAKSGSGACAPAAIPVIPNDTFFPQQWGLQRINAPSAWPISEGDPNVVVAVLDQGVELAHPDLNMWPISYSTITHTIGNGGPVGDHGTACAGIIASKIENSMGVAGLAGKCRVMAIATNFADTEVAEGLYFAADNGARVVSMSFGVYPSWMVWNFAIIEAALQYCIDKNVVLVAASGNENMNIARFPGSDPHTICVGGSNRADVRKSIGDTSIEGFWGASYGPDLDVVAPCLEIPTTDRLGAAGYSPTDYDMRFNGTSSATPHVAGLAGLVLSVNPSLSNADVRRIISQTTDKINPAGYNYLATAGKPYGTWHNEVGYGRINVERALLVACGAGCSQEGPCAVDLPEPDGCCVSPCDPPWRPDAQCMVWYESRFFRVPLRGDNVGVANLSSASYIEFRITYQHKLCLLGKQHGPLLYTVTLLPGEKVTLYHSDRYRQITSSQARFSVQTTFSQFLSTVHQARVTDTLDALHDRLTSVKTSVSGSADTGFFGSLFGPDLSVSTSTQAAVTDHTFIEVGHVSEQFNQSVFQASQLTHSERSLVISSYEDKETLDITKRTIQNDNECRAVTYFVRQVVELYAVSTTVTDVSYRVIAPGVPPDWHSLNDLAWLPPAIQTQIKNTIKLLPKVGDVIDRPQPITLPTDGSVYDPELAHCCSCEPERAAAIMIRLEAAKAAAHKACLETELLEIEVQRRKMLLQKGQLTPFDQPAALPPAQLPQP